MEINELSHWLQIRLGKPLPGRTAQLKMSSMIRLQELINEGVPENAISSGVLILLYPIGNQVHIVLMRRPDYRGVHGGQISLPGGKSEPGDHTIIDTALREAEEEIGIGAKRVTKLGLLTPLYIPPSNFIVTPLVGLYHETPAFTPEPLEVAEIIEISLEELLDHHNIQEKKVRINLGFSLKVPSYYINGNIIWGATAMILSELREIILEFKIERAKINK